MANISQAQAIDSIARRPDDTTFGLLPLFHIFGLNVVLNPVLLVGATAILVERFDPTTAAETIREHAISTVTGPPTMWAAFAQTPDVPADAFATVRLAASGASKLPVEVARAMLDRFDLRVHEGYGLTETAPIVAYSVGMDAPFGSIGRPLPGVEMRLVDDDGSDVLVGDTGEIWVRGPNVFPGYWDDQEATDAVLDPDGWLHTGDLAVIDDDGFLYIVDRAKDLIIVSGFNVYPAEVEDVLVRHPSVAEAAVVGVEHPHTGEAVKAFVVARPDADCEEDDIIAFVGQHLARYKCPVKIRFVDEIPRGLGGKILRRTLA
jgi:long-chain acyl-CoA synthetase